MKNENQTEKNRRKKVARKARATGYIKIIDLMDIMSEDENFTYILPTLRKEFLPRGWIGPREYVGMDSAGEDDDLLQTPKGRFYYWLNLVRRWAGMQANSIKERLPDIAYLECCSHDRKTDNYQPIDLEKKTPDHIRDFIELHEYEKYIEKVEFELQIQIPLPELLFPESNEISEPEQERITKGIDELGDRDPVERIDTKQLQNNSFILNGDYWKVTYNGEKTALRDLERIRYIVHLLGNPNKEFPAHHLVSLVKKNETTTIQNYDKLNENQLQSEGLAQTGHSDLGLTEEDYKKLKETANVLWDRTFTSPDYENVQQDWGEYKNILQDQYGIVVYDYGERLKFIKKIRLNEDLEKARVNVTKRIGTAIEGIRKNLPSLADHLSRAIKRGGICIYETDNNNLMNWDINW